MELAQSFEPVLAALLAMGAILVVFWCGTWIGRDYGGWGGFVEHVLARVELRLRRVGETPEPGPDVMWLVLQYPRGYTPDAEIGGIFSTEAGARAAATGELDVVGPVMVDMQQGDLVWPGAYYPNLGTSAVPNSGRLIGELPKYDEMLMDLGRCRCQLARADRIDEMDGMDEA